MDQIRSKVNDELWILNLFDVSIIPILESQHILSVQVSRRFQFLRCVFVFDILRPRIQAWYAAQIQMLGTWLADRMNHSLHPYQCTCLAHIVKVLYFYSNQSFFLLTAFVLFRIVDIILIVSVFVAIVFQLDVILFCMFIYF